MPEGRFRRPHALIAYWENGGFVIENYLTGKQTAISPVVVSLLQDLTTSSSMPQLLESWAAIPCAQELVEELITQDILLEESSHKNVRDMAVEERWEWTHDARYFHFSTQRVAFQSLEEEIKSLERRAQEKHPPSISKQVDGAPIGLPEALASRSGGLWNALRCRRTRREFEPTPIDLESFSTLLQWTWGATRVMNDEVLGPYLLKTSPSGGARHAIEVYPIILRVQGLQPGVYHYSPVLHELVLLKAGQFDGLAVECCAGQPWLREAAAVFLMTAVIERSMWKYRHSHAYRVIHLDAGHLGQTFHLVCTELGLAPFTSAALNACRVEEELGLDGVTEFAVYAAAAGLPRKT
jgi:SagB-type dehydrogenase family enzyme